MRKATFSDIKWATSLLFNNQMILMPVVSVCRRCDDLIMIRLKGRLRMIVTHLHCFKVLRDGIHMAVDSPSVRKDDGIWVPKLMLDSGEICFEG